MASVEGLSSEELDTLGVSVYHLEHVFLKEEVCTSMDANGTMLSSSSLIYEIEPGVIKGKGKDSICPLDKKKGAAYVHLLEGEDHVGQATHMLSYCWEYTIGDIVDTLTNYCHTHELDPKRTYIWICCLCVNQHMVIFESEFSNYLRRFGERVKRIGTLLIMMAPWKAPINLTRVWCIYEIFIAHTSGCKLDIVMLLIEKSSLEQDIITEGGGINALYELFGNTKIQNAKASVEEDKLNILESIESNVGCQVLNDQVNQLLRGWMQRVLVKLVEDKEKTNDETYADFCCKVGTILCAHGEHSAAFEIHRAALTIREAVLGDHPATATTYINVGNVLQSKGDYDGAMAMYRKALPIQEAVLRDHPDTAHTYNIIGVELCRKGDYDGAMVMYQNALGIREAVLGGHSDTANSYNNIGLVLQQKGDYNGALAMHQKAVVIQEKVLGAHPSTASTYNNIGSALNSKREYDGALSVYEKALAIYEALPGPHPSTAASYNNIGGVLESKGDYDGAMAMCQKALVIQEAVLGGHPDTATSYHNIGSILLIKGDKDGAMAMYQKALGIQEAVVGDPSATATTHINIGLVLDSKGDHDGAMAMYEKSLAIEDVALRKYPANANRYNNLGCVLYHKRDYVGAYSMYQKARVIYEALPGPHLSTAALYKDIGDVLYKAGHREHRDVALEMYQKALGIQEATLGDHPVTARTHSSIGDALYNRGDFDGALVEFHKSLAIRRSFWGMENTDTKDCLSTIEFVEEVKRRSEEKQRAEKQKPDCPYHS